MKTLVWVLLLTPLLYSQDYFKEFDKLGFSKKEIIDSLILANTKVEEDTILVLWTPLFNHTFADHSTKEVEEIVPIIFLLYRKYGEDFVQTIYNGQISQIKEFNSNKIYFYNNIYQTGVIKEETGLKIKAPLEYSLADIVLFITPKIKFYFESGLGYEVSIAANDIKRKYREEWANIIKTELTNTLKDIFTKNK